MRKLRFLYSLAVVSAVSLLAAGVASAAPSVPAVPVSSYGDALLSGLSTAVIAVFPYAAAITAFAIGIGLVRRWLGHKRATRV